MLALRGSFVCVVIGIFGVALFQCSTQQSEGGSVGQENGTTAVTGDSEKESDSAEILVQTITLNPRTMQSYLLLTATVETDDMVDVYPQVAGNVRELHVEEGDLVKKNDLLLTLDDRELKLVEQKAEVTFRKLESNLKRVQDSFDKKIISEVEYDNARFSLQEAELEWKKTQQNLSYARVTAPISGVIAERTVRNGERVQNSTKLFQIVDPSEKLARVYIPEKEIEKVRVGQKAVVNSEFLGNSEFKGRIERISPVVDPNSGTFKVTIEIADLENNLRIGMFVSIRLITAVHENVIAVPKDAIVYDGGLPFVYIVRDGIAHKQLLQAGFSDEQYVESTGGISADDEVIIVGQGGLKDKTKVKVMLSESSTK